MWLMLIDHAQLPKLLGSIAPVVFLYQLIHWSCRLFCSLSGLFDEMCFCCIGSAVKQGAWTVVVLAAKEHGSSVLQANVGA